MKKIDCFARRKNYKYARNYSERLIREIHGFLNSTVRLKTRDYSKFSKGIGMITFCF